MHTYTCAQNLLRPAITCTVIVFMLNADDHLLAKVPRGNMLFLFQTGLRCTFFINNSIFYFSLELLLVTLIFSLKVAQQLLSQSTFSL